MQILLSLIRQKSFKGRGQNYDVMEWTQEDLIQDIIDQYERHLHFLSLVRSPE